jgi:hypothetical protein
VSEPLQLTEASQRLRKRPGRPKATRPVVSQASAPPAAPPLTRANERTVAVVWLKHVAHGPERDADGELVEHVEYLPYSSRLLSLIAAAAYVGVSTWVIRAWLADGLLTRVKLPRPGGGEMDRLLVDVADLDRLVAEGKGP